MKSFSVLGTMFLATWVSGAAVDSYQVFEEIHSAPEGWNAVGEPSPDALLDFRIALHAADPSALERTLYDVSTPGSPNYGKYLTNEESQNLMKPSPGSREAVSHWLQGSGANDILHKDEWIHFKTTASKADSLMSTKFLLYRNSDEQNSEAAIRTTKVVLPRNIHPHIKMIHPTTRFAMMKPQRSVIHSISENVVMDGECTNYVNPACLKALYKLPSENKFDAAKSGLLGVTGFLTQYARFGDLSAFLKSQAPWAKSSNFTYSLYNAGVLDQTYSGSASEANLDIQYTVALSHPMRNHFYSTGGLGPLVPDLDQPAINSNQNEPYLEFFDALAKEKEIPHTVSFSYGENEQSVPPSYAKTVCDKIAQFGTQGATMIFASGDTGAGSACQTNDGKNTTRFLPIFPAACPYATSVGGTIGSKPERAVGFSSGGFSDLWPRPKYQDAVIKDFLAIQGTKFAQYYNREGRGFPDIAAQGSNFTIYEKNRRIAISGTSASAPVIAAIVGLLNAKRKEAGQPTLGFLNPWLYENGAQMLTDITSGKSRGCSGTDQFSGLRTPLVREAGWSAVKGWDPVTGMGTPNFEKMVSKLGLPKSTEPRAEPVPAASPAATVDTTVAAEDPPSEEEEDR